MSSLKFKSRNVLNRKNLILTVFLITHVASAFFMLSNKLKKGV